MAELELHNDLIAEIAARLELREPNRAAIESLDAEVSQWFDVDEKESPFEAVIESATGVGKTYILAGAMELFAAADGVRDFVIVTPGRTILNKTVDNFTLGRPKSLVEPMSFKPVVITSENFATPLMRAAMDDDTKVKVYIFTVQALTKPETSKAGRKTHKFQEGLGTEFYAYLQSIRSLDVFADEHHLYYGPAFSNAVRALMPRVLVGLTATPNKKTPKDQIIFKYPLSAAIADKLVKTPVIVGRRDDRTDPLTKLTDGVILLNAKSEAVATHVAQTGVEPVHPVMLVVAKDIEDAEEYGQILRSSEFFGGTYANSVLVVHYKAAEKSLEELAKVEDADSKVRVIISVGMLKEGWDVRNVYVIASMRANVSEILTEQTLGRGMRLPWGKYTEIQFLDTLEVLAHERYEYLLKKANVLNEAFIDYRTRAALRINAQGQQVVVTETTTAGTETVVVGDGESPPVIGDGAPVLTPLDQRAAQATEAVTRLKQTIVRRDDAPAIVIPVLRMSEVESSFTLSDITDTDAFRKLGAQLAASPDDELSRTLVSARLVTGPDGMKRTELVTSAAADRVHSKPTLFSLTDSRTQLVDMVLASPAVPARRDQFAALAPIIKAFFAGLGSGAEIVLSANLDRAGARLVQLVASEQRRFMTKPTFHEVVELKDFNPTRMTDRVISTDRYGAFLKSVAYEGWARSLFPVEWFDSRTERIVANMVDGDQNVVCWVRLHIGELPILWNSAGQEYNPDLIVIGADGASWVVEVKMNKEMGAADVRGKREAAMRWANYVTADDRVGTVWRYLLVSEADVETAKDSWPALKKLGT